MIFRKKASTEATWALLRAELLRLRGYNLLRAREEAIPARNELILYDEHRGEGVRQGFWKILVTPDPSDLRAIHYPDKEELVMETGDLRTFMESLASRLRGKDYLWTKKKGTSYR